MVMLLRLLQGVWTKTAIEDWRFESSSVYLDLVGGDPIRCAKSVLELLFDEQQLIIVYRMAMEIDAALAWDDDIQHPPPQLPYQTLPLQGPNNHAHRVLPLHPFNNVTETQHPSFASQPLNPISPDHSSDIFRGASLDIERGRGLPRLPNAWGETSDDDDDFWDGMHDDPIPPPPQPRPTQGLLSLPQPAKPCQMTARATVTLLSDGDSSGSQTGSSDGLIADITHIRTPPLLGIPVHSPHRPVGGGKFEQGDTSNAPALPKRNLLQSFMQGSGSGSGPSLDLRLGLDTDNKNGSGSSYVNLGDSSSNTDENDGGYGKFVGSKQPIDDIVYVGMIFKSREEFKHHMAMYAIKNKFWFRNSRSSPDGMVLRCFSSTCNWRVYAKRMKIVTSYEIRRVDLQHTCSVDSRAGITQPLILTTIISYYPKNSKLQTV
ncbi:hypothetical protein YC2023_065019 [Brassica napus]